MGTVGHADNYAKAWLPVQELLLGMLSAHDPGSDYTTLSGVTGTTATTTATSTIASNYCMADGASWYSPSRSVASNLKPCALLKPHLQLVRLRDHFRDSPQVSHSSSCQRRYYCQLCIHDSTRINDQSRLC